MAGLTLRPEPWRALRRGPAGRSGCPAIPNSGAADPTPSPPTRLPRSGLCDLCVSAVQPSAWAMW